jgi:hypothetical protein
MLPRSRSHPMIVAEQAAESLPGLDAPHALSPRPADQLVSDSLVTAFVAIVGRKLSNSSVERLFRTRFS